MNIKPVFIDKPWGGTYISECFNLPIKRVIGEAFLVSTLENYENTVGEENLSSKFGKIPYLIKLIDANQNLSIQVHPNDDFAKKIENSSGKTECWLIADASPGAGIFYGLKEEITFESFFSHASNNSNLDKYMNFVEVKKNDFVVVPAGTIHAIGAGVRLIEFQQSSGITYRIWDWNRTNRELHIDRAKMVSSKKQNSPQVVSFDSLREGIFFEIPDFKLSKTSSNVIACSSDSTTFTVNLNLDTYQFSIS